MKTFTTPSSLALALLLSACPSPSDEIGTDEATTDTTESTTETESGSTTDMTESTTDTTESTTESTTETTESTTETGSTDTTETGSTDTTETTTDTSTTDTGGDPLLPHLVGYWSFNGDANDHSGLNIDLNLVGDPEYLDSAAMGLGTAISLDGNDGAIGTNFVKFATDDATIVAWVNADSLMGAWNSIIKNWGTDQLGQFHFGLGAANADTLRNDTTMTVVTDVAPLPVGQWVHAVAVLDSVGGEHRLYVNGQLVSTVAYAAPLGAGMATGLGIGVKPNNDGSAVAPTAEVGYWIGRIDEVGMYDIALTADDVMTLYQNGMAGIQLDGTSL